jgi:hypothetical protein
VLEVTPDRIVTGRLADVRLDGLLVLPLLGTRTFTLLVVLLEPVLRIELLRGELLREEILLRIELLRGELLREEILLRVELLRGELLREEILLRVELLRGELLREEKLLRLEDEDLGVVVLVGVLTDRDEVAVLEELDLLVEGCRLLEAEEDLEVCRLLELLVLDFLLDVFSAKTGSIVSIRAKNNVPTTILTFLGYFSVAIILLL